MKAALHVLHYIHSTHDYGITFSSEQSREMHTYVHFPDSSDVEAYDDAVPPTNSTSHRLSTYSDACWGSQIGNAVREGTLLPLFKFRSMSGGIIFRCGGPVAWVGERQDKTSLSSCEAEIRATSATAKLLKSVLNMASGLAASGVSIADLDGSSAIYNDNEACVAWSHNMTSKAVRHMELRENSIREWVQDGSISVSHVSGKCNPADIFTKEMKDGAQFRRLRDSFMSRLSSFRNQSLLEVYHRQLATPSSQAPSSILPAAATTSSYRDSSSLLSVINHSSLFRTPTNISHLSSAGRHIISSRYGAVPPELA